MEVMVTTIVQKSIPPIVMAIPAITGLPTRTTVAIMWCRSSVITHHPLSITGQRRITIARRRSITDRHRITTTSLIQAEGTIVIARALHAMNETVMVEPMATGTAR